MEVSTQEFDQYMETLFKGDLNKNENETVITTDSSSEEEND